MTATTDTTGERFAEWCVLELMGHRRLAGFVTEQQIGGASFIRIDVPAAAGAPDAKETERGWVATQFYGASSVYCLTPTTEALARKVAVHYAPAPVNRWELPAAEDVEVRKHAGTGDDDL
jgi:hypothetical protein